MNIRELQPGSIVYRTAKITLSERGRKKLDDGEIEGHASIFGVQDSFGTIMDKGAFRKSIRDKFPEGRIRFLFNHSMDSVMGTLIDLREDSKGLFFRARFTNIPSAMEKLELVRDGALGEMSIGFMVDKIEIDETKNEVHFKRVDLFDVSLVTFASNPAAVVTDVRSYNPLEIEAVHELAQHCGVTFDTPCDEEVVRSGYSQVLDDGTSGTPTMGTTTISGDVGITITQPEHFAGFNYRIVPSGDEVDDVDEDVTSPEGRSDPIDIRILVTVENTRDAVEEFEETSEDADTKEQDDIMDAEGIRSAIRVARMALDRSIAQDLLEEKEVRGELEELLETLTDTIGEVENIESRDAGCDCEGECTCGGSDEQDEPKPDSEESAEARGASPEEDAEEEEVSETGPAFDRTRRLQVAEAV